MGTVAGNTRSGCKVAYIHTAQNPHSVTPPNHQRHTQVLANIPFDMRSKILRHLYEGVIGRVPLLQTMVHDDVFLTDVCVRLQHYTCSGDSFVYQRGGGRERAGSGCGRCQIRAAVVIQFACCTV